MDKERFDAVKQAFEALKTPEKRAAYDQSLRVSEQPETLLPHASPAPTDCRAARAQQIKRHAEHCLVSGLRYRNAPGEAYCGNAAFCWRHGVSDHPLQETSNIDRQPHFVDEDGHKFPLHAGLIQSVENMVISCCRQNGLAPPCTCRLR